MLGIHIFVSNVLYCLCLLFCRSSLISLSIRWFYAFSICSKHILMVECDETDMKYCYCCMHIHTCTTWYDDVDRCWGTHVLNSKIFLVDWLRRRKQNEFENEKKNSFLSIWRNMFDHIDFFSISYLYIKLYSAHIRRCFAPMCFYFYFLCSLQSFFPFKLLITCFSIEICPIWSKCMYTICA